MPDGSLLVSDEQLGAIYRISYERRRRSEEEVVLFAAQGAVGVPARRPFCFARRSRSERLQLCAGCHGADGNSAIAGHAVDRRPAEAVHREPAGADPRGAAQRRRPMQPVVKGMKDAEIVALAEHFSKLPAKAPGEPAQPTEADRARRRSGRKALRCGICHLPDFSGQNQVPRLAGQREDYLAAEMRAYRDNKRTGRRHHHGRRAVRRERRRHQGARPLPFADAAARNLPGIRAHGTERVSARCSPNRHESNLLGGAAIGVALMYFLDPQHRGGVAGRGRATRSCTPPAWSTTAPQVTARDTGAPRPGRPGRKQKRMFSHEEVTDEVLIGRVRAELGRLVSHPHAIEVAVDQRPCHADRADPVARGAAAPARACAASAGVRGGERPAHRATASRATCRRSRAASRAPARASSCYRRTGRPRRA